MAGGRATIRLHYLLIALLPALVFLLSQAVLQQYAEPLDLLPERLAEFNVYKEGAARISTLAAFMLFMGAAAAAILFFLYTLGMLDWTGRIVMVVSMVALAGAALLVWELSAGREAEDYIGKRFACLASGYSKEQSDSARSKGEAEAQAAAKAKADQAARERPSRAPQRPGDAAPADGADGTRAAPAQPPSPPAVVLVKHLPAISADCSGRGIERMRSLEEWQALGIVFAFSALVFGAICCLATPTAAGAGAAAPAAPAAGTAGAAGAAVPDAGPADPAPGAVVEADPELQHWEMQSEWLNTYLYLSALLLGAALLFLNAFLRWPAFALIEARPYEDYTSALLAYYGFAFTVMLAAFYIPVALILSRKVKARTRASAGAAKLPDAFQGPLQLVKILLGLFSTALAGTLPGILDMIV